MTFKAFLKAHTREIDDYVYEVYGVIVRNQKERIEWIVNDRQLYALAHREGVNI